MTATMPAMLRLTAKLLAERRANLGNRLPTLWLAFCNDKRKHRPGCAVSSSRSSEPWQSWH
jgi:hypothetical protein